MINDPKTREQSKPTARKAGTPNAAARKAPGAFRTISEVSDELGIPQHVLRFWESKFAQIKPIKRGGGRRYYRPEDVDLLRAIQALLYDDKYTIKGAQQLIREQGIKAIIQNFGGFAGAAAMNAEYGIQTELLGEQMSIPLSQTLPERIAPLAIGPVAVLPDTPGAIIPVSDPDEVLENAGKAQIAEQLREILAELEDIQAELIVGPKPRADC